MHIYYEITNNCNLHCSYCYSDSNNVEYNNLSYEEFCNVIDYMVNLYDLSSITFSGGEPLLNLQLYKMLDYCIHKNVKAYLITNGVLLDTFDINFLASFEFITISLHDDYKNYINRDIIRKLIKNTKINFAVVLNKNNIRNIFEYIKYSTKLRVPLTIKIQKSHGRGNNSNLLSTAEIIEVNNIIQKHNLNAFYKIPEIINTDFVSCCYFSKDYEVYTMLPNGDMFLCSVLPRHYKLGSALDKNWKDQVPFLIDKLSEDWQEYINRICTSCILNKVCSGICPGEIIQTEEKCTQCLLRCEISLMNACGGKDNG